MTTTTVVPTLRYAIGDVVCPGDRLGTTRLVQPGRGTRADIVSTLDSAGDQATDAPSSSTTTTTTHTQERKLYATVVGILQVVAAATTPTSTVEDPSHEDHAYEDDNDNDQASSTLLLSSSSSLQPLFTCSVQEEPSLTSTVIAPPRRRLPLLASSYIPRVGQLVVGTILRITPQNAVVQLLVLEGVGPITHLGALEGTIKRDDVTADSAVVTETLATKDTTTMTSGTSSNSSSRGIIERAFQPTDIISCRIVSVSSGDASNRQRCYDLSTAEVELGVVSATCKVCPRPATTSFTTPTTSTVARLVPKSWREMMCTVCGRIEPRKVAKPPGN
jgi:exosome complex RNA-binding protein Csl4